MNETWICDDGAACRTSASARPDRLKRGPWCARDLGVPEVTRLTTRRSGGRGGSPAAGWYDVKGAGVIAGHRLAPRDQRGPLRLQALPARRWGPTRRGLSWRCRSGDVRRAADPRGEGGERRRARARWASSDASGRGAIASAAAASTALVVLGHDLLGDGYLGGRGRALSDLDTVIVLDTHVSELARDRHVLLPRGSPPRSTARSRTTPAVVQRVQPGRRARMGGPLRGRGPVARPRRRPGLAGFDGSFDAHEMSQALADGRSRPSPGATGTAWGTRGLSLVGEGLLMLLEVDHQVALHPARGGGRVWRR